MDILQKRLYEMEQENPSPSLADARPTLREKLKFFWRGLFINDAQIEEIDTPTTRGIKAYIAEQTSYRVRGNGIYTPLDGKDNVNFFNPSHAVLGGLAAGPVGFAVGGILEGVLDDEDEEEEQAEVSIKKKF